MLGSTTARHHNRFLEQLIQQPNSGEKITIELEDTAVSRIRYNDNKGRSPRFVAARVQAPRLRIHNGVGRSTECQSVQWDCMRRTRQMGAILANMAETANGDCHTPEAPEKGAVSANTRLRSLLS